MTLTVGTGPLGRSAHGVFNFEYDAPEHVLYFEQPRGVSGSWWEARRSPTAPGRCCCTRPG